MNMGGTLILTHGDCDGICSGAVALSRFPDAEVFFTRPASFLDDLRGFEGYGRIVITDIALTKRDAREILNELRSKGSEILYFDHHDIPSVTSIAEIRKSVSSYVREKGASCSEIIYRHFMREIPRERAWLAIYGAVGDFMDGTQFIQRRLRNWDRRALYFEVSSIVLGIKNEEFAGYDDKRRIVEALASGRNPSDIPGLVRSAKKAVNREFKLYEIIKRKARISGRVAYTTDIPSFGFRGPSALFAATVKNAPVGLAVYERERYTDITMRTRDYSLKLNRLAERAADSVDGSGGGHEAAAGAKIPHGTLGKFIEALNREIGK